MLRGIRPVNDTIAAVATPFGEGAIAVLRMSGPAAVEIARRIFRGKLPAERVQTFGKIVERDTVVDEVLLTIFRAPASYTGEDLVEISCHGGILITRKILQLLLESGARAAEPGEFTQRAFVNGKMDLTQAEAVMDLIRAQTDLALRAATQQLEGRLGASIRELREGLLHLLAHVEAYIDFPEEDIDPETGAASLRRLSEIQNQLNALLRTAGQGRVLREGLRTVIYGAPNVGKSSLLNLLLGFDRAMVSELPGTTRDTIEEVINLRGIPLRLIDTAGMRDSDDLLEREGMARTRRHLADADLVLHVVDGSAPREAVLKARSNELLVLNKRDLGEDESWRGVEGVRISCRDNAGLDELAEAIFARATGGKVALGDASVAINARHQACLGRAAQFCKAAQEAMQNQTSPEFISLELRAALDAVGEVVGRVDAEELLGEIFGNFCIGK